LISGHYLSGTRMPFHCPRCKKNIDKAKFDEIDAQLMNVYHNDALRRGLCPVCMTPLIDTEKKVDQ
jgi:uncharacterized protein with PIN domain